MGGLISILKDIKALLKDLRETVKVTMKLIITVNKIVADVEEIVDELKVSVKIISKNIEARTIEQDKVIKSVMQSLEAMDSVKTSLVDNVRNAVTEALVKDTVEKSKDAEKGKSWDKEEFENKQKAIGCGNINTQENSIESNIQLSTLSEPADKKSIALELMESIMNTIGKSSIQDALVTWEPSLIITSMLSYQDSWLAPLCLGNDTPNTSIKTRGLQFLVERSVLSRIHSIEGPLVVKLSMWFLTNKCKNFLTTGDAYHKVAQVLQNEVVNNSRIKCQEFINQQDKRTEIRERSEKEDALEDTSNSENSLDESNNVLRESHNLLDIEQAPSGNLDLIKATGSQQENQVSENNNKKCDSQEKRATSDQLLIRNRLTEEKIQSDIERCEVEEALSALPGIDLSKMWSTEFLEVGRQYMLDTGEHLDHLHTKLKEHSLICGELQNNFKNHMGVLNSLM